MLKSIYQLKADDKSLPIEEREEAQKEAQELKEMVDERHAQKTFDDDGELLDV